MTRAQLRTRALQRLDEDTSSPVTYSTAEIDAALDEAQQLFALLTLCLEKTATFSLTTGVSFYSMLSTYADWLVPLRVSNGGTKVRPASVSDLDAIDLAWTSTSGTVERYGVLGFDLLYLWKQPASGSLAITYAYAPALMTADGDTPEIPAEYHPLLIEYALYRVREKLGANEFAASLANLEKFLAGAAKLAAFVRVRALGLRYDTLPFELEALLAARKPVRQKRLDNVQAPKEAA